MDICMGKMGPQIMGAIKSPQILQNFLLNFILAHFKVPTICLRKFNIRRIVRYGELSTISCYIPSILAIGYIDSG